MSRTQLQTAFTLIELLIVVAIITILAAIAVPRFTDAQTRAKVAKAQADMQTIGVAVESYFLDYSRYPNNWAKDREYYRPPLKLRPLTTPIAYLIQCPLEAFAKEIQRNYERSEFPEWVVREHSYYVYEAAWSLYHFPIEYGGVTTYIGHCRQGEWRIISGGPFGIQIDMPEYSPSNGVYSIGGIVRRGPNVYSVPCISDSSLWPPNYDEVPRGNSG